MNGWKDRDDFVRLCVELGLNGPQIAKLSLSTPQPLSTHQQVYDKIADLHLNRLFRSYRIRSRRVGPHNEWMTGVFMKTYGQAMEYGFDVREVIRDAAPAPGTRFRTDLGLTIGRRWFLFEVQVSKLEYTRWHEKIRHYVRLYQTIKEPFRCCFLVPDQYQLTRVRSYAREVHAASNLSTPIFYFHTLDGFMREWDVIKGKVWLGCWKEKEYYSLM